MKKEIDGREDNKLDLIEELEKNEKKENWGRGYSFDCFGIEPWKIIWMYEFTRPLSHRQGVIQGQF